MAKNEQKLSSVSWSAIKEKYPASEFIHVLPAEDSVFQHEGGQDWRLDVTIVDFNPYDEKDCYAIESREAGPADVEAGLAESYKNGNYTNFRPRYLPETVGLSKSALERLTAAAGASIVPIPGQTTLRVDDRSDFLYHEYACMAALVSKNGEIRTDPSSRAWDGRTREAVIRRRCEKRFERVVAKDKKVEVPCVGWKKAKECSPDEQEATVRGWLADDWLREREYGPLMAESKAKNRARRSLLALPAKFTVEEIRDKSFIVPRWVFSPDMSDPEIRRAVIAEGLTNQRRGFLISSGPAPALAPALPEGTPVETIAATGSPSSAEDEAAAEAAEDAAADQVDDDTPFGDAEDAAFEEIEEEEKQSDPDPDPEDEDEIDDVELIPDAELSFYVAKAIARYKGSDITRVKNRWNVASQMNNPHGYKELRDILRHIYKGLSQQGDAGKES